MRVERYNPSTSLRSLQQDSLLPSCGTGEQVPQENDPAAGGQTPPTPASPPASTRLRQLLPHLDGSAARTHGPAVIQNITRPTSTLLAVLAPDANKTTPAGDDSQRSDRTKCGLPSSGPANPDQGANDPEIPRPIYGADALPLGATRVPYRGVQIELRPSLARPNAPQSQVAAYAAADALYRPAAESLNLSAGQLMRDDPATVRPPPRFGTTMALMAAVAANSSPDASNLLSAAASFRNLSSGGGTGKETLLASIEGFEHNGEWSGDASELPHYIRHPGATGLQRGDALANDLERHFSTPYNPYGDGMGYPDTLALVRLSPRDIQPGGSSSSSSGSSSPSSPGSPSSSGTPDNPDTIIAVQRLHTNGDYRNNTYTLYDPSQGAFRYANFNQLSYALSRYYSAPQPTGQEFSSASTSYYAMQNVLQHPMAEEHLGDVGGSYGIPAFPAISSQPAGNAALPVPVPSLTPPRANLPRLPEFDQPGPSGYQPGGHQELKRSADSEGERQPVALYRPSPVSPADLKTRGGFNAEQTPLGQVNLDMHNFDVASHPSVIDGAGYLGTFRKPETAQQNPALVDAKNGYVYAIAPTPNMVDVDATLGPNAHRPETGEVAAMGRIDYTQIRGWQKMESGKLGAFTPNPDYRWDIYDQTRTAGAQPQLSRFAVDNPASGDSARRPFTVARQQDGKTIYAPRQEPNLTQADFYAHALEKIAYLNDQQAKGLDYRGPVKLVAHNGEYGTLQGNVHMPPGQIFRPNGPADTDVTVTNNPSAGDGYHTFQMGDDGRFHTRVFGEDEVLRVGTPKVGSQDYLYLDHAPKDPKDRNGVFRYLDNHLIHEVDHKSLTYSYAGNAYVSKEDYESDYSKWKLTDGKGHFYSPPKSINLYYDGSAGSARTQYEFEKDPDSALPPGVTYFATQIPGGASNGKDADAFMRNVSPKQRQQTADWLNRNNAALLFKDGFYLTATGERTLEVRNLQGNPVRSLQTDAPPQADAPKILSNYRVDDRTWARLENEEERREKFEDLSKTSYAVT